MRWALRGFTIVAAVLALHSCTPDERIASTVRDSAGIEIVENALSSDLPEANGELQLSIGVEEGPLEYQFYLVTGVARLSDGRIVAGEAESGRLRWFDSAGQLVRQAGGRGSGPGEFRYIGAVVPMAADSVAVWGGLLDPISIFDSDGEFVRQEPLDRARISGLLGPQHMTESIDPLPDGSFVLSVYERRDQLPTVGEIYRPRMYYHRVAKGFESVDTMGEYGGFPQMMVDVGDARPRPAVLDFPVHARMSAGGRPLRIYAGNGERFEVDEFNAQGTLRRIIRVLGEPRPVSSADLEAYRDEARVRAQRNNQEAELERVFAALPTPTHFPAYDALEVSPVGGVWVRAWTAPTDSVARWHVFDDSGSLQRIVILPASLTIHQVGDGWVLGVETDSLEVERLRLYAVE